MPQNDAAFAQFYARNAEMVYRICYIRMKNRMDAEDITQETFLRAMEKPELFGDMEHGKAWLIVTASNLCHNAAKHWLRTKRSQVSDWSDLLAETQPPPDAGESSVLEAVMELPDSYKTVVYLFYYEGYSGAEIADILQKKESTVRSLLHRARKLLSKSLGGESDGRA